MKLDAFAQTRKNDAMKDTWGHMFPEPKSKHPGKMTIAVGEYGDSIIVTSEFKSLQCSPQRYALEMSIFDEYEFDVGVHHIECTLWFFKGCRDAWLGERIGRIIGVKLVD